MASPFHCFNIHGTLTCRQQQPIKHCMPVRLLCSVVVRVVDGLQYDGWNRYGWPTHLLIQRTVTMNSYRAINDSQNIILHLVLLAMVCFFFFFVHYTLPGQTKLSFRFKSANYNVMIWSCFSWSGLTQQVSRVWECTEWPGYPINGFFLPWWLMHIPGRQCQDSLGSACERVEHGDTWVSGSTRSHFHTWIGHHRVLNLTPFKYFGLKEKTEGMIWLSSHQYQISGKN